MTDAINVNDQAMVSAFMREMGSRGGKARLKTMSKKARSESASKAAKTRWKNARKTKTK